MKITIAIENRFEGELLQTIQITTESDSQIVDEVATDLLGASRAALHALGYLPEHVSRVLGDG